MNNIRKQDNFYPENIEFCEPNALKSSLVQHGDRIDGKVRVAIFDMDGTTINTSSPAVLVRKLAKERKISVFQSLMILCWGIAYKYQLPRRNNPVRQRVFTAFRGKPWQDVNQYLQDFFNSEISHHIRTSARQEMDSLAKQEIVVVMVSASFDSVVATCMTKLPIAYGVASLMKIDENGNYTNKVEGIPPEGKDKLTAFEFFANREFGEGNWTIEYSFGDHLSDRTILEAAKNPIAVTPDKQLENLANEKGWKIVNW